MTMSNIEFYPVFEADQVLTNHHLNDTVSYLERQDRLTRVRLIGNGIVSGLELTVSEGSIVIGEGHGITSQGYLIHHCRKEYTHYTNYRSPDIPTAVDFIKECGDGESEQWPIYGVEGVFELLPADVSADGKKTLSALGKSEYVVMLLLETKQTKLKNCDTNDCNEKGSRLDFTVKPLLVHIDLLTDGEESDFHTLLLKRYAVPQYRSLESGEALLSGFYDLVDDETLANLEQNLLRAWDRYAVPLGLPVVNPFEKLDLKAFRDRFNYQNGNFHYIQYFYDFIDDLTRGFREFEEKAHDFWGVHHGNEALFPLHLTLGLASESTRFGYSDRYRQYFVPVHYLRGKQHLKEEVALLLQRLHYMVADFDGALPPKHQTVIISPSQIGSNPLSDRSIPFYYHPNELNKWWSYRMSGRNTLHINLGYHLQRDADAPEAAKNPLFYDIERFNAFRIEGHVGKPYATALSEIIAQRDRYNLPFDVLALNAADLDHITDGTGVMCLVRDLESYYNVLIAGLLCRVKQLLTFVGGLRPKRDNDVGDIRGPLIAPANKETLLSTLSKKVTAIRKDANQQKRTTNQPVTAQVNYIAKIVDLEKDEQEVKLMDFVATDIQSFLVADRKQFEYVLPKPDLLLVFLQRLNAIFAYLFEHDLRSFDAETYNKLWAEYESTVNSIIKESANSQNEELKSYFDPKNSNVLFTCANEELYAIKEEYNQRLSAYQEAATFARYFDRHKGLEHKAGVPKGGTFVLVYQPSTPRYAATLLDTQIRLIDRPVMAIKDDLPARVARKESSLQLTYADTVRIVEKLELGIEATKVLDELKKREEAEKPASRVPGGVVIADFYVPYLVKSNCQPIAYVFPENHEPPTLEEPREDSPSIVVEPSNFCSNDKKEHTLKVYPAGGKLTINGKESGPTIVPARLGAGTFDAIYTLPSGAKAAAQFMVAEALTPDFEVVAATYSEKEGDWELRLKGNTNDPSAATQWLIEGKPVGKGEEILSHVFTVNQPRAAVAYNVAESLCGNGEKVRTFVRDEQNRTVCSEASTVTIPVTASGDIALVSAPKGVAIQGGELVLSPVQLAKQGLKQGVIAYHYASGDTHILSVLTLVLGTASFEATFEIPTSGVATRTDQKNTVNIVLQALSPGGTSQWTVNGKKVSEAVTIPLAEFEKLKELAITHQIDFGDGHCGGGKTFTQTLPILLRLLEAGKGKVVVE